MTAGRDKSIATRGEDLVGWDEEKKLELLKARELLSSYWKFRGFNSGSTIEGGRGEELLVVLFGWGCCCGWKAAEGSLFFSLLHRGVAGRVLAHLPRQLHLWSAGGMTLVVHGPSAQSRMLDTLGSTEHALTHSSEQQGERRRSARRVACPLFCRLKLSTTTRLRPASQKRFLGSRVTVYIGVSHSLTHFLQSCSCLDSFRSFCWGIVV